MLNSKSTPIPSSLAEYQSNLGFIQKILHENDQKLEEENPGKLETIEYFIEKILLRESGIWAMEYIKQHNIPSYPDHAKIYEPCQGQETSDYEKDLYLLQINPLENIVSDEHIALLISQYREYNKNFDLKPPYVAFDTRRYDIKNAQENITRAKKGDSRELKKQLPALEQLATTQIPVLAPADDVYFKQGRTRKDREYFAFHNLQKIGVKTLRSRQQDGHYVYRNLPRKTYFDAMKKVLPQDAHEYITNLENRYEKQVATRTLKLALRESKNAMYTTLNQEKYSGVYHTIKQHIPEFEDYALQHNIFQHNFAGIIVDESRSCIVYATNKSQSYGTGPMKYYLEITVRYKGQVQRFEYIYRNPSNINAEDRSWSKPHLGIQKVSQEENGIQYNIVVQNSGKTKKEQYSARFSNKPSKNINAEAFQILFTQICENLRKGQTRENGVERVQRTNSLKHREEAIIKEQYIDPVHGVGAVIIQTQIDTGVIINDNKNKQYGFYGYIFTADGDVKQVRSETAREKQLGWMPGFENEIDRSKVDNISNTTAVSLVQKRLAKTV